MRNPSLLRLRSLPWLAWMAVGPLGLAACSLDLGYLEGHPDGGVDASAFDGGADALADSAQGADVTPDHSAVDGSVEAGSDADATVDAPMDAAPDVIVDAAPDGPAIPDGGFGGCAEVVIPFATGNQQTDYTINLSGNNDFSTVTISMAIYAPDALGGSIEPYIQNNGGTYPRENLGPVPLTTFSTWKYYTWTVPTLSAGAFDAMQVFYLGFAMESGSAGPYQQPNTLVYIGSILVNGSHPNEGPFIFRTASSVSDSTTANLPQDVLWLNLNDSHLMGADLVWDPTCGHGILDGGKDSGADAGADSGADARADAGVVDAGPG